MNKRLAEITLDHQWPSLGRLGSQVWDETGLLESGRSAGAQPGASNHRGGVLASPPKCGYPPSPAIRSGVPKEAEPSRGSSD